MTASTPPRSWQLRVGPIGLRVRRRLVIGALTAVLVLLGLLALAVFTGTLAMPVDRVVAVLSGGGTRVERLVVIDNRLAPALAALLVGFALGCAGGLTQSITRNPIASPDILGVTSGAGAFAVLLITTPAVAGLVGDNPASSLLTPAAIVGGLLTAGIILALSWRTGFDGVRVVLVGLAVNALALAGTAWMLTRTDLLNAQVAVRWLSGSVNGVKIGDLWLLAGISALALFVCIRLGRDVGALRLGRDVAATVGTVPGRVELVALAVAVILTSASTAVAGPIAFVAFVAPQIAMRLFRTAGPPPLVGGLAGAGVMMIAAQVADRLPGTLPVGVLTPLIGAPYLLFLMRSYVRKTSG
ncbi:FecCD family ABC transporter permease [Nakamurella lactea]|uniref:FecCD family ABC transporter permease n=1 Tax=Nakamurella lactea TaxID=459515 RepID=UPI0004144DA8|nr:iron ABC transporter permease [Nakamurella lactea]